MIWLRLVCYVLWRGLLYGSVAGIIFGTLVSPFDGTGYGFAIGTIVGAVIGLVNGITLSVATYLFFNRPSNRSTYFRCVMILIIPLDLIAALVGGAFAGGVLSVICALTTATTAYYLIFGFVDYAIAQLTQKPSLQPSTNLQINN